MQRFGFLSSHAKRVIFRPLVVNAAPANKAAVEAQKQYTAKDAMQKVIAQFLTLVLLLVEMHIELLLEN